jgi:lipoate-protein ligase A
MLRTRLIPETEPHSGWFQMAADDFLAGSIADSDSEAILRFYLWNPPAVSLGFHQKPEVIDLNACLSNGWDVARRPTGGRALLHCGDLSYAIILKTENGSISQLHSVYQGIANAIAATLSEFGAKLDVNADLKQSSNTLRQDRVGLCLTSRARGEVLVEGRKVAAAAQRLYPGAILQHGSLTMRGDTGAISTVAVTHSDKRQSITEKLRLSSCSVEEAVGHSITVSDLIEQLTKNIRSVFDLSFKQDGLVEIEYKRIIELRPQFDILSQNTHFPAYNYA